MPDALLPGPKVVCRTCGRYVVVSAKTKTAYTHLSTDGVTSCQDGSIYRREVAQWKQKRAAAPAEV